MCVHRGEHACSEKHERASRFFLHFFQENLRAPKAGVRCRRSARKLHDGHRKIRRRELSFPWWERYVFVTETEDCKAAPSVSKTQSRELGSVSRSFGSAARPRVAFRGNARFKLKAMLVLFSSRDSGTLGVRRVLAPLSLRCYVSSKAMRGRIALLKHCVRNGRKTFPFREALGVRARPRAAFRK